MNPNLSGNVFSAIDPASNKTVFAIISPCSWMNQGYGTQLQFCLKEDTCNAESIFINDKSIPYEQAFDSYIKERLHNFIHSNGVVRLEEKIAEYNERLAKLRESSAKREEEQQAQLAKDDAIYKAKGFTHRVMAFIHSSGDDKQIGFYTTDASEKAIQRTLKKQGCQLQNDYTVVPL